MYNLIGSDRQYCRCAYRAHRTTWTRARQASGHCIRESLVIIERQTNRTHRTRRLLGRTLIERRLHERARALAVERRQRPAVVRFRSLVTACVVSVVHRSLRCAIRRSIKTSLTFPLSDAINNTILSSRLEGNSSISCHDLRRALVENHLVIDYELCPPSIAFHLSLARRQLVYH